MDSTPAAVPVRRRYMQCHFPSVQKFVYLIMASLQIDILNPKASKLLKDLADLKLIAIRETGRDDGFLKAVKKIRAKGKIKPISLEDITKEVEAVGTKRYAKRKGIGLSSIQIY